MGSFDMKCSLTNMPIAGGDKAMVIPIVETAFMNPAFNDRWTIRSWPIRCTYHDYSNFTPDDEKGVALRGFLAGLKLDQTTMADGGVTNFEEFTQAVHDSDHGHSGNGGGKYSSGVWVPTIDGNIKGESPGISEVRYAAIHMEAWEELKSKTYHHERAMGRYKDHATVRARVEKTWEDVLSVPADERNQGVLARIRYRYMDDGKNNPYEEFFYGMNIGDHQCRGVVPHTELIIKNDLWQNCNVGEFLDDASAWLMLNKYMLWMRHPLLPTSYGGQPAMEDITLMSDFLDTLATAGKRILKIRKAEREEWDKD